MLTKNQKQEAVAELKRKFESAVATVVVENRGLTVAQVSSLRAKCRAAGVDYKVSKNRLVKLALKDTALEPLGEVLTGPNGIAYSFEDPVAAARTIDGLLDEFQDKLVVKGGTLFHDVIAADRVKQVARMPGRQEIYAMILGGIQGPATGILYSLTGLHQKLWGLFTAYAEKLEGGEGAAAEA